MATERELNIILRAKDEASKVLKDIREGADQWGKALTAAGAAGAAGFGAAVKAASDFEAGLSNVKAISGASTTEMKNLHDLALQLGKDTAFSASEAVAGMEELIKSGLTPAQVQAGALKGSLDLAAAGELELKEAAEIASTALNTFKLKGEDMTMVANTLAGAANASATDVRELKFALSQAGLVAAQAGVSFQDTATTLAVFAQNGLKGSDAGTSMKTMLMRLNPTTNEAAKLMKQLNMITADGKNQFYDAAGNMKSMSEVAGILQSTTSGLTAEQRQFFLGQIFGQDAIRGVNALLSAGKDGFDDMAKAMGKVTAAEVAGEKLNNLKGSLEQLKGSLETIAITIGERLLPYVRQATDFFTNMANRFLTLSPATQDMIVKAAGLATGFALIAGPALLLVGKLGAIGTALGALTGPVGLIIAGLGLLYLAFVNNWGGIRDLTVQTAGEIVTWFTANWPLIRDTVVQVFNEISAVVGPVLSAIVQMVAATFPVISEVIKTAMSAVKIVFDAVWPALSQVVKWFVDSILPWVVDTFQKIAAWIAEVMPYIRQIIEVVLKAIMAVWQFAFDYLWPIVKAVFEVIKSAISLALDVIMGVVKFFLQVFTGDWAGAWQTVKQLVADIWNGIVNIVKGLVNVLWTWLNQTLGGWPQKIWGALVGLWDKITDIWEGAKRKTVELLTALALWVYESFFVWPKKVWDALVGLWQVVADLWQGFKQRTAEWLANIWSSIWDTLTGWIDKAKNWASNFISSITSAIGLGKKKAADASQEVAGEMKANLELNSPAKEGPLSTLDKWWKPFVDTLVGDNLAGAGRAATQLAGAAETAVAIDAGALQLAGTPAAVTLAGTPMGGARGPVSLTINFSKVPAGLNEERLAQLVEERTMAALVRMGLA